MTIPLSDLDDSGCAVVTGVGGVRQSSSGLLCLFPELRAGSPFHHALHELSARFRICQMLYRTVVLLFAWYTEQQAGYALPCLHLYERANEPSNVSRLREEPQDCRV